MKMKCCLSDKNREIIRENIDKLNRKAQIEDKRIFLAENLYDYYFNKIKWNPDTRQNMLDIVLIYMYVIIFIKHITFLIGDDETLDSHRGYLKEIEIDIMDLEEMDDDDEDKERLKYRYIDLEKKKKFIEDVESRLQERIYKQVSFRNFCSAGIYSSELKL